MTPSKARQRKTKRAEYHRVLLAPPGAPKPKDRPFIYTITTLRDTEDTSRRCVGWFPTFEEAEEIVKGNYGDLAEAGYYKWAVIERFASGLYAISPCSESTWYRFTQKKAKRNCSPWNPMNVIAKRIRRPKRFAHLCNFGVG
jgi:hypothetical protein